MCALVLRPMTKETKEFEDKREALRHKTFVLMLRVLVIVGIPAFAAYFGGQWLDTRFDMRPTGSVIAAVIGMAISWIFIIRIYTQLRREYRAVEKEYNVLKEQGLVEDDHPLDIAEAKGIDPDEL